MSTQDPSGGFDLAKLRLSQSFADQIGVKRELLTVPVRKPNKQKFFRVHPSPEYRFQTALLVLKDENETYIVDGDIIDVLAEEVTPTSIFTTIDRQGTVTLCPIRLPKSDGKIDSWSRSALLAMQTAEASWTRMVANMSLGAYDVFTASALLPEPEWPDKSFPDLMRIAFQDRIIASTEHPVVKKLRGQV